MIEHLKMQQAVTECQRVFHGRGHAFEGLSHVNIDWFPPVLLVTLYQTVEEVWLAKLTAQLSTWLPEAKSIQAQHRYQKGAPVEVLKGDEISKLVASEHGLKYHIDIANNQNHGLFLDMRNGRQWLLQNSKDKTVLNLFAYTCAFSVAAIAGGADKVVNIDMSKSSLAKGRDNHRLNEHDLSKVKFEGVDIFKSYNKLKKHGPYDVLVCDPPSFQKGSVNIERDYKKIIKRIPQLVNDGADVILCLNSPDLDEAFLKTEVARECPSCEYIEKLDNPAVFIEAEQGKGLKVLRFKYNQPAV